VERIKLILVSQLGVDPETVAQSDPQTPLIGRGIGLDSVEAMALAVSLEEEFDIEIPDDDLTSDLFQSIATLDEYVREKRAAQATCDQLGGAST
jgi:acyl carrier protein